MKKLEDYTYEEALEELEKLIKVLEEDESSLEEALKNYKRGIELHKYCSHILSQAEEEVKVLLEKDSGEYEETVYSQEVD